jgi:Mrp family chromosome partitioning ATPase
MEKLRAALQKAREQRGEAAAPLLDTRRLDPAPSTTARTELWAGLQAFDPDPRVLERNRVVTRRTNPQAIPFDRLSTKTRTYMRKNEWRRLAITSPTPGCGKSLVAANLALSLARQPDIRTLLIEIDMRRPTLASLLGASPSHDLSEMLTGAVPFEEQALRIGDNLAVSLATRSLADPGRLLQNAFTPKLLKDIETRYQPDLVIFDMPPLAAGAYTLAFLGNVDCALTVVRAGRSTVREIDTAERDIAEHTNVLGVVLNQCDFGGDAAGSARDYAY